MWDSPPVFRREKQSGRRTLDRNNVARVVIVCAEREMREAMAYWLTLDSMEPVLAADGYDAAHALRTGCRWLITDRVLPPWPGLDLVSTLRRKYPSLAVIFIENSNVHETILARVLGAHVTLPRPLTRRALRQALGGAGSAYPVNCPSFPRSV